ncbi:MAG TPA: PAS domain-containing protein [Aliidongia sp.]|uniref:PAS domain-containing protein n=1 Tax=Aliidongia sp. TaxID=1914230 RepID=UPI002DDD03C2|nr:PAS domain-containing protein [Aliidongia sp.]HEV2673532.1 PAS domain-containing protein [Aliidongia sp.]
MTDEAELDRHGLETGPSRLLLGHWLDVRGEEPVPRRADIDPGALKWALPHIFMLNMVAADTAIYRLVGTAHRARWGIELTGHVWGEFLDIGQRVDRTRRLWRAVDQPCGFTARYDVVFASGAHDPVETLLLPLRPNDPSGCPILIGTGNSRRQIEWVNQPGSVASRTAEQFRFLDLGYGIPAN